VWVSYVLKFNKRAWSWRHWVPAIFILGQLSCFGLGAAYRPFLWLGAGVLTVYLAVSLVVSLQIAIRERDSRLVFQLPAVFAIRHFVHGLGTLYGLVLVILPGQHWKGRRGRKA
jgi:hypothetical protein